LREYGPKASVPARHGWPSLSLAGGMVGLPAPPPPCGVDPARLRHRHRHPNVEVAIEAGAVIRTGAGAFRRCAAAPFPPAGSCVDPATAQEAMTMTVTNAPDPPAAAGSSPAISVRQLTKTSGKATRRPRRQRHRPRRAAGEVVS
jgi:hypothetical protein